jgi:pyroglutamyl-peptidase
MKRLLITGFEPFGGESVNPSWEAVDRLPSEIGDFRLSKLRLPVVFGEAARVAIDEAEKINPDAILCIGQAGGRDSITPELVAINLRYAVIPDNAGNQPKDEPIIDGGENALFSTLPVRRMSEALNAVGIPSKLSYSAGAYVCNDLLYTLLDRYKDGKTEVCFVHVPYCTEQGKEPSMSMDSIVKGLSVLIESL